jgi:uncharacterized membrane protein YgaE (UPF0421/DUF939 family)
VKKFVRKSRQALERANWHRSLKMALAATLCYAFTRMMGIREGYWASISAIVVMQSEMAATARASLDRFFGTAIGALFGWLIGTYCGQSVWAYAFAVLAAVLACGLIGLHGASRLSGITVTIILLAARTGDYQKLALSRFIEVNIGIIVALLVSVIMWPRATEAPDLADSE